MCHSEDSLVGNDYIAALVGIDIICLQDVSQVTVIVLATYIGARSCLSANPSPLSLYGIECCAITVDISRAIDEEAITMVDIQFGELEGTHISVIYEDIILSCSLDGEVSQVFRRRIIIASSINAIGVSLFHDYESGSSRSAFAILD